VVVVVVAVAAVVVVPLARATECGCECRSFIVRLCRPTYDDGTSPAKNHDAERLCHQSVGPYIATIGSPSTVAAITTTTRPITVASFALFRTTSCFSGTTKSIITIAFIVAFIITTTVL